MFPTRFLSPDAVTGVSGQQRFNDGRFRCLVHFGDEVVDLLLRNTNRFDIKCRAVDDGASSASSLDGHIDHGMEIRGCHKF